MCNFDNKYNAMDHIENAAECIFNIKGMNKRDKTVILNSIFSALARVDNIAGVGENGDFKVRLERIKNV